MFPRRIGMRPSGVSFRATSQRTTSFVRSRIAPALRTKPLVAWPSAKAISTRQVCPEEPRVLPSTGFILADYNDFPEEDGLPIFADGQFYPVRLGEVFQERYQVITKLGSGEAATVWLARDLRDRKYVALKAFPRFWSSELTIKRYKQMAPLIAKADHPGGQRIRGMLDSFTVGENDFLVLSPVQMSFDDLLLLKLMASGRGFDEDFVKAVTRELLLAVDFLHAEVDIIHTQIHATNLFLGVDERSGNFLEELAEAEFAYPSSRRIVTPEHTVYASTIMDPREGPLLLSSFSLARCGGRKLGTTEMLEICSPEVVLRTEWSFPIDIWSVGLLAWKLFGMGSLFTPQYWHDLDSDATHLAQMIAVLGPPPESLLRRSQKRSAQFWDEKGTWKGLAPIPNQTLESLMGQNLQDSSGFLKFLRRTLTWVPEERASARDLLGDPWLRGARSLA